MTNAKSEFQFHKAVREQIRLLIGLSGGTGSGKTYSAMRLAKGLSGDKRFAVIDTENGRASMYADYFDFDVLDLTEPFTSEKYQAAILAADAKYPVIVVDSFSHEYEGDGGILDRQETALDEMVKKTRERGDTRREWEIEDSLRMLSWRDAKLPHRKLMTSLTQRRAHIIFGLRAEEKIEITKNRDTGKTEIKPKRSLVGLDGWIPICEKKFPYELTVSFLLTAAHPGVPLPIKLQEQHKLFFPLDKPITEDAGRLLGEWAKGGSPKAETIPPKAKPPIHETKPGVYEPISTAAPNGSEVGSKRGEPQTAVEYFKRIETASSVEALNQIGVELQTANISDEDKKTARQLYAARKKELSKPKPMEEPLI